MGKVFNKSYQEITEKDLNEFSDGLCSRMLLFQGDYPSFLPYLVSEVINHPQINQIDKDQLGSYCDMFELNWREDILKPLIVSPVYLNDSRRMIDADLQEEVVAERVKKAGIPYLASIKDKIIKYDA